VRDEPDDVTSRGFRVEELAARSGAPVRTIREYQTWRILHPPTRVGRVGYYDDSHVRRLAGIARLQERGYSIAAIRDLFDSWEQGAGLADVLDVDDAIGSPPDEAALVLTRPQLAALLPAVVSSERLLARACSIGVVEADGECFVARSPALVQLTADVIASGRSPSAALDLAGAVVAAAALAGSAAAAIVAAGAEGGIDAIEPIVRRGRVLLTRAVATHTVDQAGRHLRALAVEHPELGELLDDVRIGTVATRRDQPERVVRARRAKT